VVISRTREGDGAVVVEVRGEIDLGSVDVLRKALNEAAELRPPRVVVDLSNVTLIDSSGLSALVNGRYAAHILGVPFAVRRPSPFVTTQLLKTGLYDVLVADE
jgi:anti-anti-sigma factor